MNYFKLFNLPQNYQIDLNLLKKEYLKQQLKINPDNNATEKLKTIQATVLINEAYNTLKTSHLRAAYLLQITRNINLDPNKTIQEQDFLIQQMEWSEDIEEAITIEQLETIENNLAIEYKKIESIFEQEIQIEDEQKENNLTIILQKMNFISKLRQHTKEKIRINIK